MAQNGEKKSVVVSPLIFYLFICLPSEINLFASLREHTDRQTKPNQWKLQVISTGLLSG